MVKIPVFVTNLFPSVLWKGDSKNKVVYLTFDDGPTPDVTSQVLSILSAYKAKATFFCLGNRVEKFPELYQSLLDNGHQLGNHTFSHFLGVNTNNKEYFQDIEKAGEFIDSKLFRPPYGKMKLSQYWYLKSKFKIVLWDVIPGDYKKDMTAEKLINNVVNNVSPGSIVVLHDSEKCAKVLLEALPVILKELSGYGYEFQSIKA